MCSPGCIEFSSSNLSRLEVEGNRVLEIGSLVDITGSSRPYVQSLNPSEYIGIDVNAGEGVDIVCTVEDALDKFGKEIFDIVISTEVLEHVLDWRKAISNIKNLCKQAGVILITTRSIGFIYHPYPYDFWRFQPHDIVSIFDDCIIKEIRIDESDSNGPGVMAKIVKPLNFKENDLSDYRLYSMVVHKRILNISIEG